MRAVAKLPENPTIRKTWEPVQTQAVLNRLPSRYGDLLYCMALGGVANIELTAQPTPGSQGPEVPAFATEAEGGRRKAKAGGRSGKTGGGWPKVVEHQELTISRWYEIQWRRQEIDLTELAKRRWIDKWAIERLAEHFGFGPTRIKFFLNRIKDNPDLVSLELGSGKKRPWAVGRVFRGET